MYRWLQKCSEWIFHNLFYFIFYFNIYTNTIYMRDKEHTNAGGFSFYYILCKKHGKIINILLPRQQYHKFHQPYIWVEKLIINKLNEKCTHKKTYLKSTKIISLLYMVFWFIRFRICCCQWSIYMYIWLISYLAIMYNMSTLLHIVQLNITT